MGRRGRWVRGAWRDGAQGAAPREPSQADADLVTAERDPAIDQADGAEWPTGEGFELRSRSRASADLAEAQYELQRLRTRYWSGERLLEEAKADLQWWEHPDADPYAVLDLLPGATIEEASAARRRIARRCHPDLAELEGARRDQAIRHMVAANAAYERLRRGLRPVLIDSMT
jgi:hypothetical protein